MPAILEIKDLSVDFKTSTETVNALRNISFKVNKNEIVALVGESGSGKSVTSLSILQLVPTPPAIYSSGEIIFYENDSSTINLLKADIKALQTIRGNKIGMIFQEPMTSLNPVLTCGKQVAETLELHKNFSKREAKEHVINWFRKVKLPDPEKIYSRYPHELSGGQKQRVMIAMAMCCEPDLLICDEPTTALDVTVQKTVLQLIKELQQQSGMGVIFITHDLGVVAEIADRALVMYKGEIVEQNTIRELFLNPQHDYTKALLACRPADQPKGKRLPVVSDFITLPGATESHHTSVISITSPLSKEVLLSVQHLSVWFPAEKTFFGKPRKFIKAVNNVSFDLYKGETLGLVGESGCGKTTLGRTLLRLVEPNSGSILYNGTDLLSVSQKELIRRRKEMQIVFQDPYSSLNPRISIGSAIAEPMKVHGIHSGRQVKEKVAELLQKVDLSPDHYNRYPHEFSGGQRQRIVIARSLALNPSFIVCDESVSALDVSVQAQVLNLLNDLKKEFGFTVIFISHDLSVIRYISDRIMVMNKGEIVETGKAEDVYQHPSSDYTRQLIASVPKGYVA